MVEKFIMSWYFVAIVLGTIFLLVFKSSIEKLIDKIKLKNKKIGISTEGEQGVIKEDDLLKIEDYFKKNEFKKFEDFEKFVNDIFGQLGDINRAAAEDRKAVSEILEIAEFYQFSYLNLYLVLNSKLSLLFFYNCGGCTKDVYLKNFSLAPTVINPDNEREIIFSTLLSNTLIEEKSGGLFNVSAKGIKFLKFIRMIK